MGVIYNSSVVTDGLVGYWDAGNSRSYPGSGTTWFDLSGNRLNGNITNSPTFSSENGGNFSFNGTNQYVSVPYSELLAPTAAISFSSWAFLSNWNITDDIRILSKTQTGGYQIGLNEATYASGNFGALVYASGTYRVVSIPRSTISSGWHHSFFTFDGQYFRMYMDGNLVDEYNHGSTITISYSTNNHFVIGAEPTTGTGINGNYWSGKISQVQVYNRALTYEEVKENYNAFRGRFGI